MFPGVFLGNARRNVKQKRPLPKVETHCLALAVESHTRVQARHTRVQARRVQRATYARESRA